MGKVSGTLTPIKIANFRWRVLIYVMKTLPDVKKMP
jgi:hypothetical protein